MFTSNFTTKIAAWRRRAPHEKGGKLYKTPMQPVRDWWIGLGVSALVILGSAGWGTFVYITNDEGFNQTPEAADVVPYDARVVDEALRLYRYRADVFAGGSGVKAADPVVPVMPSATSSDPLPSATDPTPEPTDTLPTEVSENTVTPDPALPVDPVLAP